MTAPRPFDDIRALLLKMPGPDEAAVAAAREREAQLTKPAGSLGRLEEISAFLAGWQGSAEPHVDNPLVAVFAGNHGVAAQGRLALSAVGHPGDGGEFHGRRRGDQPDLQDFRHLAEGLRTGARQADRRHHAKSRRWTSGPAPATIAFGMEALACGAGSARRSAKWASATRPPRRRSITRSTAARRRTGSGAAPASTTPG